MTGFLPPIRWRKVRGARARNHLWGIEQTPGQPFGAAILAEEVREWNAKGPPAFAAALAAGLAVLAVLLVGLVEPVLGAMLLGIAPVGAAVLVNNLVSGTRALELTGKAVNWRARVRLGQDSGEALAFNARTLRGYPQFRGVPEETIARDIRDREAEAERWLARHWPKIAAAYAKGNPG